MENLKLKMRKKLAENAKVNLTIDGLDIIRTYDIDSDSMCKIARDHITTQIEALRERLMKNAPSVLAGVSIEETINNFLKEIND